MGEKESKTPTTTTPAPAATTTQMRRKLGAGGVKTWVVVTEAGEWREEEVGKQCIMRRTGLPARDLRALDPALSYPSSILGRERAIVVNLEHIKAIITAKEVFMLSSTNPLVVQFLQDLSHRINVALSRSAPPSGQADAHDGMVMEGGGEASGWEESFVLSCDQTTANLTDSNPVTAQPKLLPFEFRALEACLESACRCLESETKTLENEAYPALDELTSKISTLNLERVRQIKSRLVALSGRVQKVRDEIEHLLDDDMDMAEMYLSDKLITRSLDQTLSGEADDLQLEVDDERANSGSEENAELGSISKPNIEELEMLLEAYFVQIDGTLQKLSDMSDYVDDTEDFINIMLDDKQNQLLQMGVIFSTANMILNAGIVVVGLFGMNIHIELFDGQPVQFWETVGGTAGGCIACLAIALGWGLKRNLLAL